MKSQKENTDTMLVMFREMAEGLTKLTPDSRHRIIDSVLNWFCGEDTDKLCTDPTESLIVEMIKSRQRAYVQTCRKRREAGEKGGRNAHLLPVARANPTSTSISMSTSNSTSESTSMSTSESDKCKRPKAFTPPTVEEVADYCRERGSGIDAQAWHDYYVSNGWRVGRSPMKDWRAAVRTWERRERPQPGGGVMEPKRAANWRGTKAEGLSNAF